MRNSLKEDVDLLRKRLPMPKEIIEEQRDDIPKMNRVHSNKCINKIPRQNQKRSKK